MALRKRRIGLLDCLLSGYALFALKYPSLLQFEQHYKKEIIRDNLHRVYGIKQVPSDTYMREQLDEIEPSLLRKTFTRLFAVCQRSKFLDLFSYYEGRYLLPIDGTGFFYSKTVHCEHCCEKKHRDGSKSYYHQMVTGSIVHPDLAVVLPFAPEPIVKSDGAKKNDCERRGTERFLAHLKREHPHLKLIITGDGLFSNGPYIKALKRDGHRFILVAKESDHKALFEEFNALPSSHYEIKRDDITHTFQWHNGSPLNDSHLDCLVNVLDYWETDKKGRRQHWAWVTDIPLSENNVFEIMKGGRARHKIENETFNTLKNQGYEFEHNFGHGKKQLSTVFAFLMMLAFFVDQLQQLGCKVFQKALKRLTSKKNLWEQKRSLFFNYDIDTLDDLWLALANGFRKAKLAPNTS